MSVTFGHSLPLPSMRFDRESLSWRTCEATSLWDLEMSSPSFPEWGMTLGGELFELPTPARLTVAQGSSSLPTPHAGLGERGRDGIYPNPNGQQDLQHALAALLPTPTADHSRGLAQPGTDFASLPNVAILLLPTPRAQNEGERNQNVWVRPADQPQNLENALARLPGVSMDSLLPDGSVSSVERHQIPPSSESTGDHDSTLFSWNG
jgi:hypothetical protein